MDSEWWSNWMWRQLSDPAVVGATLQAVATVSAAGLAVYAARTALHGWKKEAPGRRKVELAEKWMWELESLCRCHDRVRYLACDLMKSVTTVNFIGSPQPAQIADDLHSALQAELAALQDCQRDAYLLSLYGVSLDTGQIFATAEIDLWNRYARRILQHWKYPTVLLDIEYLKLPGIKSDKTPELISRDVIFKPFENSLRPFLNPR